MRTLNYRTGLVLYHDMPECYHIFLEKFDIEGKQNSIFFCFSSFIPTDVFLIVVSMIHAYFPEHGIFAQIDWSKSECLSWRECYVELLPSELDDALTESRIESKFVEVLNIIFETDISLVKVD